MTLRMVDERVSFYGAVLWAAKLTMRSQEIIASLSLCYKSLISLL